MVKFLQGEKYYLAQWMTVMPVRKYIESSATSLEDRWVRHEEGEFPQGRGLSGPGNVGRRSTTSSL